MNEPIVSIRSLVKEFKNGDEKLTILKDLDLDIEKGSSTAILGQSGSGKSTLLNIIGGLDTASSGTVKVGTWQLERLAESALNSFRSTYIGFIFQFHYLLKDFTAVENIMLPSYIAGLSKKEALLRAKTLIDEVGLSERAGHYPSQLSGGERQRIALARALINDPQLILADEPTGNLDPSNSRMVSNILFDLCEKHGKTLVLVTHDSLVAQRASVQLTLERGSFETAPGSPA